MKYPVLTTILCISALTFSYAQTWSFAVITDPMNDGATFRNALVEIRDTKVNPKQKLSPAEFVVVCGDLSPPVARYKDYNKTFEKSKHMKSFFPVKGNHDNKARHTEYIVKKILPNQDSITTRDNRYVNYSLDWKNARFIIVDQYSDLGSDGCINSKGKEWVEGLIQSADRADHVFVIFHEPAFPRFRHIDDSFNACPKERDEFWNMLLKYKKKVKAVLNGHIHFYYRMRVFDPTSEEVQNINKYPDQEGGIYQINCGSSGQGDRNTIVRIQIHDKNVSFIVLDADDGRKQPFSIIDGWAITGTSSTMDK